MRGELADEQPYQASIGGKKLRLPELQAEDQVARKMSEKDLKKGWKEIDGVLYRKGRPYLLEIIRTKIISRHHDEPLAGHFGVEKPWEWVARKYYWPTR